MRSSRFSAYLASAALHLGLFLLAYVTWPMWSKPTPLTEAVPVTILARAPAADVRPAEQAPLVQTAAAPEPAVEPQTPASPAPTPAPEPAPPPPPPAPAPVPKPAPKPAPAPVPKPAPRPAPVKARAAPTPDLNLDQLAAQSKSKPSKTRPTEAPLDLSALAGGARSSRPAAARGPPRPETDLLARLAVGKASGLSGDAMSALQAKLNRLWNPNCQVEGGAGVMVRVEMKLTPDGRLAGEPSLVSQVSQSGSGVAPGVVAASAQRALSAIKQGEPYTEIPRDGPHDLIIRFNAKQACAS